MSSTSIENEPVAMTDRSFGRLARNIAGYGLAVAFMLTFQVVFVFIPALLFHCGIRNGRRAAWGALAFGTFVAGALVLVSAQDPAMAPQINSLYASVAALILAVALPALAVLPLVERGEKFGRVLMFATLLGMAGLALTEVGMRALSGFSPYADQVARAKETSVEFMHMYQKAGLGPDVLHALEKWMDIGVFCLTGFLLINIVVVFVLSLVMLSRLPAWRRLLAERGAESNPYLFRNLSLPEWLLFAFVAGGATPLLSGFPKQIGANVLTVVAFLYLLHGLAIFRAFLAAVSTSAGAVLLGVIALGTLTVIGIGPLLLSIAGLFDSFFDFRHFNRKDDSHEGHTD